MEDDEAIDMTNLRVMDERFSIGAFIANATTHDAYMQEEDDLLIAKPPPPAPKNRANKMTFAFGDDDDEDENENDFDEDQVFVPKPVTKQPQKNMFFSQKKKKQITIAEDPNED
jgi:serine/threonine protein phosphatase PrpC